MSKIYVDEIAGIASADTVAIPGHVIQVVQIGTFSNTSITTLSTWTNTNMTLAITPSSTSSKILVTATCPVALAGTGGSVRGALRLQRTVGATTTTIWNTTGQTEHFMNRNSPSEMGQIGGLEFLDEPSTTSSVTYTLQGYINGDAGANCIRVDGSAIGGNLVLKEIAG